MVVFISVMFDGRQNLKFFTHFKRLYQGNGTIAAKLTCLGSHADKKNRRLMEGIALEHWPSLKKEARAGGRGRCQDVRVYNRTLIK